MTRKVKKTIEEVAEVGRMAGQRQPRKPLLPADKMFKVRAIDVGYYDDERKREGDEFVILSGAAFSKKWMEKVCEVKAEEKPKYVKVEKVFKEVEPSEQDDEEVI